MRGVLLVADFGRVADVDAEALEEALVAGDVDRDLARVQVEHARSWRSRPRRRAWPSPTGRSARRPGGCRSRTWRPRRWRARAACRARSPGCPRHAPSGSSARSPSSRSGVIRMALAPAAMRFSMAATWESLSPSCLPANDCSSAPSSAALASRALLHLHEERVRVGLGDQADEHLVAGCGGRGVAGGLESLSSPQPAATSANDAAATAPSVVHLVLRVMKVPPWVPPRAIASITRCCSL